MRRNSGSSIGRAIIVSFVLVVASLGPPLTSAIASTTTSTTLPPAIVLAGNAYSRHLLDAQPIPPETRRVTTLPTPLLANGDMGASPLVRQDHHLYLLPLSVSVDQYVRAHLPKGERITETGTGTTPNAYPTQNLGLSVTCTSPHITFCGVYYQTTEATNGQQELRVDVQVVYLPILHVAMPTDGVVTVTGYAKTSLMNSSSDPTSVVLTAHQVLALRSVISNLKDLGTNLMCAEDSLLLRIKIVKHGRVEWRATADVCPGSLTVTSARSTQNLDDRSCSFWHVVDLFFPSGAAQATKSESTICADPRYG